MAHGDPYEALGIPAATAESARLLPASELAQAAGDRLLRTEGALPADGRGPGFAVLVPGVIEALLVEPKEGYSAINESAVQRIAVAERLVDPLGLKVVAEVEDVDAVVAGGGTTGMDWPPGEVRQDVAPFTTTDIVSALAGMSGSERTGHLNVRENAIALAFGALLDQAAPERNPLPPDHNLHPDTVKAYEANRKHMARADAVRLEFAARIAKALGYRQVPNLNIEQPVAELDHTTLAGAFVHTHAEAHDTAAGTALDLEDLLTRILSSERKLSDRENTVAYELGLRLIGLATRPNRDNPQVEGQ